MIEEDNEPIYSVQAQQIVDDPGLDADTAIKELLRIQIELLECAVVALWNVEDSLKLRVDTPKKGKRHDA